MGHSLALASDKIRADMIESIEFPHLANKYNVYGVPKIIINETTQVEGALPEPLFVAKVLEALGMISAEEMQKLMDSFTAQAQAAEEKP